MGRTGRNRSDREMAKTIALDLPDVEISHHHNSTELRVHNRVFARLPAKRRVLECRSADGWTETALDDVDAAALRAHLIAAWLRAAPADVRSLHEARLARAE